MIYKYINNKVYSDTIYFIIHNNDHKRDLHFYYYSRAHCLLIKLQHWATNEYWYSLIDWLNIYLKIIVFNIIILFILF